MSQRGSKTSTITRINTLKGWARGLGMNIPLVPKPVSSKPKKAFKKR